jgi:hypothetical protein
MNDDEAILIKGAERYSDYSGYGNTFRFVDMQIPQEPSMSVKIRNLLKLELFFRRDELGRAEIELVAMDALSFSRSKTMQFGIDCINRELGKV